MTVWVMVFTIDSDGRVMSDGIYNWQWWWSDDWYRLHWHLVEGWQYYAASGDIHDCTIDSDGW